VTDLLRLPGLVVTGTYEEKDSLIVQARSRDFSLHHCCLFCTPRKNGTKVMRFRDFAIQAQPVWIEVKRQRVQCKSCGDISYENLPDLDPQRQVSVRFRQHLERDAIALPFTTAASINGVHETLIRRIFSEVTARKVGSYQVALPRVLGMDEIYIHRRPRFVIGDVENRTMLDMQESRSVTDLKPYFQAMTGQSNVEVVCQDMWKGYHTLTKAVFPRAATVIDKYHVQRTANYGMEVVRKALYLGMPNKERVALKRKKAMFLTRWDSAKPDAQNAIAKVLGAYPALQTAYTLKEQFYDIYEAPDRAAAEIAVDKWLASVPSDFERPFKTSIDALRNWRPHILRYFEHRFTSAYIERMNGLIRKMNVQGAGYSFEVLRAKALLKHGRIGVPRDVEPETEIVADLAMIIDFENVDSLIGPPGPPPGIPLSTLEADLEAGTF
jgi:transposase